MVSVDAGPLVLPSGDDPLPAGAVEVVGGPPGRHARLGDRRFWTPLRWIVLLTLAVSALGFWQKAPCRVHDWSEDYQYTRACYTDVFALYYAEQLNTDTPYLEHPVEYPVLIGVAMGAVAAVSDPVAGLFPGGRVAAAEDALADAQAAGDPARADAARSAVVAAEANSRGFRFFDLTWVLLTGFAVVVAVTTARLAGRRPWDAAMFALSPALLLHGTTNWDLIAVAFAGLGLLAWARRMPVAAGVLLGLGAATKLYPLFFLVPLLALCWRTGQLRAGVRTVVAAGLTGAVLVVPAYLVSPAFAELTVDGSSQQVEVAASPLSRLADEGLAALAPHTTVAADPAVGAGQQVTGVNAVYRFVDLNRTRPADWDSIPYALSQLQPELGSGGLEGLFGDAIGRLLQDDGDGPAVLNLVTFGLGFVVVPLAVVALAVRAPRRPRLPQLLLLAVIGFLLTSKVYSPQYVLWLVPLVILARPRWRLFGVWMATEAVLLFARFYFFVGQPPGEDGEGIDVWWFVSAVLVRDAVLVVIAALVVRDVLRPEFDVVRADGVDDPAGGLLDGAEDRVRDRAVPDRALVG